MSPQPPGPRTPDDVRWIRSGNDCLHAVLIGQPRTEPPRTHCGRALNRLSWSSFCGPRVARKLLELSNAPLCSICDGIVGWVDPDAPPAGDLRETIAGEAIPDGEAQT